MFQNVMIFSKCHRNVSKQTNASKVDDSITNKSWAILEAFRIILDI